jgi:hypothetical protein
MTSISNPTPSPRGLRRRLWTWLPALQRRPAKVTGTDTLPERVQRDIGLSETLEQPGIRSLHDAMRYSG